MQQPSKRAWTRLSRAPAYATRKRAPGDIMADRPQRRVAILGYNNTDLTMFLSHHPELSMQEIADRCGVSKNIVQHWLGKKGGHRLPMPTRLLEKLSSSVESSIRAGELPEDRYLRPLVGIKELAELMKS